MAVLLITHDLGVVAESADRVLVMYAGHVMEQGTVAQLFEKPLHPYTEGLLRSIPQLDTVRGELHAIPGSVPSLADLPAGCVFSTRCERCMDICRESRPVVRQTKDGRSINCWLYEEEGDGYVG
jgi:oligopeptide/dipeptide ABC transporter ATP-binding protein